MPWLIFALGLGLAAAGGASIWHGYPYMQIEFGWTEVIAGSTAVSGGVVTIALGALLLSLASLRRSVERGNGLRPNSPVGEGAPTPLATPLPAMAPEVAPAPAKPDAIVAEPKAEKAPRPEGLRERLASRSSPAFRPVNPPVPVEEVPSEAVPTAPTVAGRYESGGASYILFSDGTIEVESEGGKHRFGSMDELKTFMARERPDKVEAESLN